MKSKTSEMLLCSYSFSVKLNEIHGAIKKTIGPVLSIYQNMDKYPLAGAPALPRDNCRCKGV
jgi:hypothetical protein